MMRKTNIILVFLLFAFIGFFLVKPKALLAHYDKDIYAQETPKPLSRQTFEETSGKVSVVNKWEMPPSLVEISGIAWIDEDRFACVQDEEGIIYIYNGDEEQVEREIKFAGRGDYEGIALVEKVAFVMRSDGAFYKIDDIQATKPSVTRYETHLTAKNDVEGFAYDKRTHRLLAAIKGDESGNKDFKGIYAINLANNLMAIDPVFKLSLVNTSNGKDKKRKEKDIQPSDIAVHPLSHQLYIIDASIPSLRIVDASGTEIKRYILNKKEFSQPEGISFSSAGKLFISNEGRKEPGNILEVELDD